MTFAWSISVGINVSRTEPASNVPSDREAIWPVSGPFRQIMVQEVGQAAIRPKPRSCPAIPAPIRCASGVRNRGPFLRAMGRSACESRPMERRPTPMNRGPPTVVPPTADLGNRSNSGFRHEQQARPPTAAPNPPYRRPADHRPDSSLDSRAPSHLDRRPNRVTTRDIDGVRGISATPTQRAIAARFQGQLPGTPGQLRRTIRVWMRNATGSFPERAAAGPAIDCRAMCSKWVLSEATKRGPSSGLAAAPVVAELAYGHFGNSPAPGEAAGPPATCSHGERGGPVAGPGMFGLAWNSVQPHLEAGWQGVKPYLPRPANGRIRIAGRRRASAAWACGPSHICSRAATKRTRSGGLPAAPVFSPATAGSKLAAAVEEPGFLGHVGSAIGSAFDNTLGRAFRTTAGVLYGGLGLAGKGLSYLPDTAGQVANAFGSKELEASEAGFRTLGNLAFGSKELEASEAGFRTLGQLGGLAGNNAMEIFLSREAGRMRNEGSTGLAGATQPLDTGGMRAGEFATSMGAGTSRLAGRGLQLAGRGLQASPGVQTATTAARATQAAPAAVQGASMLGRAARGVGRAVNTPTGQIVGLTAAPPVVGAAWDRLDQWRGAGEYTPENQYRAADARLQDPVTQHILATGTPEQKDQLLRPLLQQAAPYLEQSRRLAPGSLMQQAGKQPLTPELFDSMVSGKPQQPATTATGGNGGATGEPPSMMNWRSAAGLPLGLFGLLQLLQGKGGIGPLLMTLLGGGMAGHGMGLFGGQGGGLSGLASLFGGQEGATQPPASATPAAGNPMEQLNMAARGLTTAMPQLANR